MEIFVSELSNAPNRIAEIDCKGKIMYLGLIVYIVFLKQHLNITNSI